MKLFMYVLIMSMQLAVIAEEKKEEPEVIPRGTLTIYNRSKNGCYLWFSCYSEKSGRAKKLWHPDYNPAKKTVKPLILYPNQGAEITIPDDECFYSLFSWWGTIFKKVEKKVAKEHRCRNIILELKGDKELGLDYSIILTDKEKEDIKKKEEEEAAKKEEEAKAAAAGEPVAPPAPQPAPPQKKGYWV